MNKNTPDEIDWIITEAIQHWNINDSTGMNDGENLAYVQIEAKKAIEALITAARIEGMKQPVTLSIDYFENGQKCQVNTVSSAPGQVWHLELNRMPGHFMEVKRATLTNDKIEGGHGDSK